ncbi:uncharacterized protein LOC122319646 [Drosophila yakuba]|uniref:uncharacterized protein LOC122319646 n=1 Tax=Drosophila yakuba TaxID=7245 RepID=UPI001C8ACB33|nr:uncharacterized protein LOC122319646 [Drosophila yakuba]
MPIGDDKKKLSADKPRSIFSPQGPKSSRIPSISVKTSAQISDDCATPSKATVQCTAKNMAASDLALAKFISVSDRLSEFEAQINIPKFAAPTVTMLSVRRDQVRTPRDKVEKEFDLCSECLVSAGLFSGLNTVIAIQSMKGVLRSSLIKSSRARLSPFQPRTLRPRPTFPLAVGCLHAIQKFSQATIFAGRLSGIFSQPFMSIIHGCLRLKSYSI